MAHVPLTVFAVAELGGVWIAVEALLLDKRDPSRSLYDFGLHFGSAMIIGAGEITTADCDINQIPAAAWLNCGDGPRARGTCEPGSRDRHGEYHAPHSESSRGGAGSSQFLSPVVDIPSTKCFCAAKKMIIGGMIDSSDIAMIWL